jgi:hypothetical protein
MAMIIWSAIAVIGVALSLWGLMILLQKYRLAQISWRYFLAAVVGYVSFVTFAIVSAIRPATTTGLVTVFMLLPALLAVLVIIRERRLSI